MEAVDVLDRRDGADDPPLVHLLRQRQLDEDAGDALVGVQVCDEREQVGLGRLGGELVVERLDPYLLAGLLLAADVESGGLVLADEHRRQPIGRSSASTSRFTSSCTRARAFPSMSVAATAGERTRPVGMIRA